MHANAHTSEIVCCGSSASGSSKRRELSRGAEAAEESEYRRQVPPEEFHQDDWGKGNTQSQTRIVERITGRATRAALRRDPTLPLFLDVGGLLKPIVRWHTRSRNWVSRVVVDFSLCLQDQSVSSGCITSHLSSFAHILAVFCGWLSLSRYNVALNGIIGDVARIYTLSW